MAWDDPFFVSVHPQSTLPKTPAGRLERVMELSRPVPIVGDDGEPTGEYMPPVLSPAEGRSLLNYPDLSNANAASGPPTERHEYPLCDTHRHTPDDLQLHLDVAHRPYREPLWLRLLRWVVR